LDNRRNFVSVDVPVGPRQFLVGPNASGKSNLLDALRFLSDLVIVGGGLEAAVENRGEYRRCDPSLRVVTLTSGSSLSALLIRQMTPDSGPTNLCSIGRTNNAR